MQMTTERKPSPNVSMPLNRLRQVSILSCLIAFFLSPFAGLAVGLLQFALRRDDVIPYVPYLCLGSAATVVAWARLWNWAEPLFEIGWLVPTVLVICLVMLGVILALWGIIKRGLFGADPQDAG